METAVVQDHGVQVGDLFACSWGYAQTQVDFYEVVGLTPSGKSVKGSAGGEAKTYRIKDATWGSEVKYAFKVNSFSNAYKGDWDSQWTVTGWGYGH